MQMNHAAFDTAPHLRAALARGIARQAIAAAERAPADLPALFRQAAGLRPNRKGLARLAGRLAGAPGMVRAAVAPDAGALTLVARAPRRVETRAGGRTVFAETGLIYLRARVALDRGGLGFALSALALSPHAAMRLVERSSLPLAGGLLPALDAEALALFRAWGRGALIRDDGDEFYPAACGGVWAGAHDRLAPEADWGLSAGPGWTVPVFSARTFLDAGRMRPTVWLRWRDDPACRIL